MFFRKTFSKNSKSPILQLVENIRTINGVRQKLVVSLGTQLNIPKDKQKDVARTVKQRLHGQQSMFDTDPDVISFADRIVKKIQTEGKWNSIRDQVVKFRKESESQVTAEIFVNDVEHGYNRELGPVLIGHYFWNYLKFPEILKECGFNERQIQSAEISILNRLIAKDSENAILSWLQTVALEDIMDLDMSQYRNRYGSDRFYGISDKLLQHQEEIETEIYQREKSLFNLTDSIFLYDLTNTYFEGQCRRNPKAEYGGNQKEKRNDCPYVVAAMVLDGEGFIRHHRVFNGKMKDTQSLAIILNELKKDSEDQCLPTIVFDRGVVSEENLELLKQYKGLEYIVACRPNEEFPFIEDFRSGGFNILEGRDKKCPVEIMLKQVDEEVFLLCKSEGRKAKETAIRNKSEQKLEEELKSLQQSIQKGRENRPKEIERRIGRLKERYSKVAKYYEITYTDYTFSHILPKEQEISKRLIKSFNKLKEKVDKNDMTYKALKKKLEELKNKYPEEFGRVEIQLTEPILTWKPIDEKQDNETSLDGKYLLKTSRKDLHANEIWHLYMMLTNVEESFRYLKSYLGIRPVFHQKEKRVDGHIFISILAYHLLHSIEYTLRQNGINSRWSTIKRVVSTHSYSTIQLPTVNGAVINLRKAGIPESVHEEIYKKLGVNYKNLPIKKVLA